MYKAEAKPNLGLVSQEYGYTCPACKRESAVAGDVEIATCLCGTKTELAHVLLDTPAATDAVVELDGHAVAEVVAAHHEGN